jgi:hypothetical protein
LPRSKVALRLDQKSQITVNAVSGTERRQASSPPRPADACALAVSFTAAASLLAAAPWLTATGEPVPACAPG